MSAEAIILIPGMKRSAVHNQRARLIAGLEHVWEVDALTRGTRGCGRADYSNAAASPRSKVWIRVTPRRTQLARCSRSRALKPG